MTSILEELRYLVDLGIKGRMKELLSQSFSIVLDTRRLQMLLYSDRMSIVIVINRKSMFHYIRRKRYREVSKKIIKPIRPKV